MIVSDKIEVGDVEEQVREKLDKSGQMTQNEISIICKKIYINDEQWKKNNY